MGLNTYSIGDQFTPGGWNADYVLRQGEACLKADSLVTAKTTAKAITKLFSLHGACYPWRNGNKVSTLQGHMWQDQ